MQHADEVVDAAVIYRQAGEPGVAELLLGLGHGHGVRNGGHPDEGHHHLLDGAQAELEDAVDEEALLALEVHFRAAFGHHQAAGLPG